MNVSLGVAVAILVAGCGDNSRECGPGTTDEQGVCTGVAACGTGTKDDGTGACGPDGTVVCTDGTIFDAKSGTCQDDPASCQDGTVLIGTSCVDPTRGLTVDAEEGPEPNGLGVFGEASAAPAGVIQLKSTGTTVVHGTIVPVDRDGDGQRDPDVDSFLFTTTGPTYVHTSADGVHGLEAGFELFAYQRAPADLLGSWQRFGVNLSGDTSQRDVYLPAAGTYVLAIADTHTFLLSGQAAGAATGAPAFEYYVSLTPQAVPTPTSITAATTTGMLAPGEVKFFSAPTSTGFNDVQLMAPAAGVSASDSINGALVLMAGDQFRNTASERTAVLFGATFPIPAELAEGGFDAGASATIVVDTLYDFGLDPVPFSLTVTSTTATPLLASGATSAPQSPDAPSPPFIHLTWFTIDVANDGDTDVLELAFNSPVDVALLDQHFRIIAPFTWLQGQPTGNTLTGYQGLIRFPKAGRYYLGAYDPTTGGGNTITTTGGFAKLAVPTLLEGTATSGLTGALGIPSFAARYDAGTTDAWQVFGGFPSTGTLVADFYADSDAFGRLDPVTLTVNGTASTRPATITPLFSHTYPQTGGSFARILLDDPTTKFYVHLRGADASLDFVRQDYTDLGTLAPAATVTETGTLAGVPARYLFRSAPASRDTLTATGTQGPVAIELLANDESILSTIAPVGNVARAVELQTSHGWTALEVTGGAVDYTLGVSVLAAQTYHEVADTVTFADACAGGTTLLTDADEDVTGPIAAPSGFVYFGAPEAQLVISANGWLSFDTSLSDGTYANDPVPSVDTVQAVIAPYWDDLDQITVCTKTSGTKLIVQWTGEVYAFHTGVQVQAILDGATGVIQFVYGPAQLADGKNAMGDASNPGATIGIEDPTGLAGRQVGFNASAVSASTSLRFTPD